MLAFASRIGVQNLRGLQRLLTSKQQEGNRQNPVSRVLRKLPDPEKNATSKQTQVWGATPGLRKPLFKIVLLKCKDDF